MFVIIAAITDKKNNNYYYYYTCIVYDSEKKGMSCSQFRDTYIRSWQTIQKENKTKRRSTRALKNGEND